MDLPRTASVSGFETLRARARARAKARVKFRAKVTVGFRGLG